MSGASRYSVEKTGLEATVERGRAEPDQGCSCSYIDVRLLVKVHIGSASPVGGLNKAYL